MAFANKVVLYGCRQETVDGRVSPKPDENASTDSDSLYL